MKYTNEAIGKSIQRERLALGMTTQELGSAVGLTRASISNIENGRQAVSLLRAMEFCDLFGSSLDGMFPPRHNRLEQAILNLADMIECGEYAHAIAITQNILNPTDK